MSILQLAVNLLFTSKNLKNQCTFLCCIFTLCSSTLAYVYIATLPETEVLSVKQMISKQVASS